MKVNRLGASVVRRTSAPQNSRKTQEKMGHFNFVDKKIPYYVHIESLLRNRILTGQLEPGDRLPKETELAAQFGVSQITVRSALAHLEAEGLITRHSGKGTFVAMQIAVQRQTVVTGNLSSFIRDTQKYEVRPLAIETVRIGDTRVAREVRRFFERTNNDPVCVVRRVRLLNGIPVTFVENYLPPETAEHLSMEELLRRPVVRILEEKLGIEIEAGEAYLESVPADHDIAEALQSNVFAPLFLLQGHLLASGTPFELVNNYMRPDYFKFKLEMGR